MERGGPYSKVRQREFNRFRRLTTGIVGRFASATDRRVYPVTIDGVQKIATVIDHSAGSLGGAVIFQLRDVHAAGEIPHREAQTIGGRYDRVKFEEVVVEKPQVPIVGRYGKYYEFSYIKGDGPLAQLSLDPQTPIEGLNEYSLLQQRRAVPELQVSVEEQDAGFLRMVGVLRDLHREHTRTGRMLAKLENVRNRFQHNKRS